MRQSLVVEILEHLAVCGTSLMVNALFMPYGQSMGRAIREIESLAQQCSHDFSRRSRNSVSVTLSRLKLRGLVARRGPKKKTIWQITSKGRFHFKKAVKEGAVNALSLPPDDGKIRLVVFDVPEKERRKRDWLRARLLSCDYASLQKSVWVGTRPLPESLLSELKNMALTPYVHVMGLEGVENVKKKRDDLS